MGITRGQKAGAGIAGGLGGAATGAALGSIVPGLGTGIGAILGGLLGVGGGVGQAGPTDQHLMKQQAKAQEQTLRDCNRDAMARIVQSKEKYESKLKNIKEHRDNAVAQKGYYHQVLRELHQAAYEGNLEVSEVFNKIQVAFDTVQSIKGNYHDN